MFGCGLRLAGGSLMRPLLVFHWMMDESIVTKLMVPKKDSLESIRKEDANIVCKHRELYVSQMKWSANRS